MPYLGKKPNDTEKYFFISYKHIDSDRIKGIVEKLNYNVWYDEALVPGQVFSEEITKHIRGCEKVVFFLSKNSVREQEKEEKDWWKLDYQFIEYVTARDFRKTIEYVFIEDIVPEDASDLMYTVYLDAANRESFGRKGGGYSEENLAKEINESIEKFQMNLREEGKKNKSTGSLQPETKKISASVIGYNANKALVYLGNGLNQLFSKRNLVCMYNINRSSKKSSVYDLRYINNLDSVFDSFNPLINKDFNLKTLFLSSNNKYLYYHDDCNLYKHDLVTKKIHIMNLKRFLNDSYIYYIFDSGKNFIYILSKNKSSKKNTNEIFSKIILFDLENNCIVKIIDLSSFNFNMVFDLYKDNNNCFFLFINTADELCVVDINNNYEVHRYSDCNNLIQVIDNYYKQPNNFFEQVDSVLSHDGLMYGAKIHGAYKVTDIENGCEIVRFLEDDIREISLLKNKSILSYDTKGNVFIHTHDDKKSVLTSSFFMNTPEFCGKIPFMMKYDEVSGNYLFVICTKISGNKYGCKLIIVDKNLFVCAVTDFLSVPYSSFYGKILIEKDKIFLCFYLGKDQKSDGNQSTFVYVCEYNR